MTDKIEWGAEIREPDPTPAERFQAENPYWHVRDRDDLIVDVLEWAAKQDTP